MSHNDAFNVEINFDYLMKEPLEPFTEDTNLLQLMRSIQNILKDSQSPDDKICAIYDLRRLWKNDKTFFISVFDNIQEDIYDLLSSENLNVLMATLTLVCHVFSETGLESQYEDWVNLLLPAVLNLSSTSEKDIGNEIKQMSYLCLNYIISNSFYTETVLILIDGIASNSSQYAYNSLIALYKLIENCDKAILLLAMDWNEIVSEIEEKFAVAKKKELINVISFIQDNLKPEEWEEILKHLEDENFSFINELTSLGLIKKRIKV